MLLQIFYCLIILGFNIIHAENTQRYWIYFIDKGKINSEEIKNLARNTLSERAIKRRLLRNTSHPFDFHDIPLNKSYIQILKASGIKIHQKSKWFNAVSAHMTPQDINQIKNFAFIKKIEGVRKFVFKDRKSIEKTPVIRQNANNDYGASFNQNEMIGIPSAHAMGYEGEGVRIAIFDTGFLLTHEALQNVKVISTWDFVQGDSIVSNEDGDTYTQHNHGTEVLAAIGGYNPGQLIGPANKSEYLLAKTEDLSSETHMEEDNWAAAAEWADSLGADIITSSVGYNQFDPGEVDYSKEDMDGNTTIVTKAADLAVKKGITVFTSAGNEGNNAWGIILAPGDGDSVITVGGVNPDRSAWSGSSHGPTADFRIKPDIMAQGISVYTVLTASTNEYTYRNGTSYACPLTAGAGAILLSINPNLDPVEVRELLRSSASQAGAPDNNFGWGIIDLEKAIYGVKGIPIIDLFSFKVKPLEGKNEVSWVTNMEIKNDEWSISRKTENTEFSEIGRVEGQQLGLQAKEYLFYDLNVNGGETFTYRLSSRFISGKDTVLDSASVISELPKQITLFQNYPNPFNTETRITFSLLTENKISLEIFDIRGRIVNTLIRNQTMEAKFHHITWDGKNEKGYTLSGGTYFARLRLANSQILIKLLFLK